MRILDGRTMIIYFSLKSIGLKWKKCVYQQNTYTYFHNSANIITGYYVGTLKLTAGSARANLCKQTYKNK